jgi:hypothetical protein
MPSPAFLVLTLIGLIAWVDLKRHLHQAAQTIWILDAIKTAFDVICTAPLKKSEAAAFFVGNLRNYFAYELTIHLC